ncbi:hypothetical protein FRC19_001539 [Serendipita sp. 401]|nr:hypothetical protein FRC15_005715 [Serendipita sp. 397]KAG8774091.1 hypothetical protein FRC16_005207 [Serendipita sp. 398]KAG8827691.1 hypothetical protein FRC19_001539 [Serendipita sp. 401]KAG8840828.1 hypothetical protein FRC20_005399 [Serendipita sp. 405]KAG9058304.1 hypothetical protein FS842_010674 [Serendipita sp. 407]
MSDPNVVYIGSREMLSSPILSFRITGSPVDPQNTNSVLHWHCYCLVSAEAAVMVDMIPGGDTRTGVLSVKYVNPVSSSGSSADIVLHSQVVVTTADVISLLTRLGRTRYKYSDDGSGCRFWCCTILQDLKDNGYVQQDAVETFDAFITERNEMNPLVYPLPTRQGTFY